MRPNRLRGLLLLNAALLGVLALVTLSAGVDAQMRPRGQYTMVGGNAQGAGPALVYIVDEVNQQLVSVVWDKSRKDLTGVGFRNLAIDGESLSRRRN